MKGATDPAALNYDPEASIDDGSCEYPPNPGSCSEVEFDGHTYAVVEIGLQCWFAENLQSTVFASGTSIEEVISDADWSELSTPGQCIYENEVMNLPDYGRLLQRVCRQQCGRVVSNGMACPPLQRIGRSWSCLLRVCRRD